MTAENLSERIAARLQERCGECDKFDPDGTFSPLEHRIMTLEAEVKRLKIVLNDTLDALAKSSQEEMFERDALKARLAKALSSLSWCYGKHCHEWLDCHKDCTAWSISPIEEKALDLATPTKWNVVDFFKSLTKEEMQELLHATALITDPLGQELIRKACEEEKKALRGES